MVTTRTVVQICYKSILLVLTKTPGRWKTVLVVVTLPKGHRLIPGFNSLMLGDHLKLTNHRTSYDLSSPSWFLQTSIPQTHTLIKHNAAVSQVIKNNRLLKQSDLTYIKSLPECVPWKMSKLSPSHLYKVQKEEEEERTPALYSTRKEQSRSWIELSGCLEHGKAELVSICTRTTCWVTRSPASVKSSRLLLWLNAPCHHLHATSWFIPQQQDVETVRLRCIQHLRCRRKTCRHVYVFLLRFYILRFGYTSALYSAYTHIHTVFLSVGQDTIKSVRAGWKMKLRWVMCLSSLWPLLLCPYDITQQGGNHGKLQSQSCYSEAANCSRIICILGTHASTQRVYLFSHPGIF